jgi:hypothetical protein
MSLSCNLGSARPAPILTKPACSAQRVFLLACRARQVADGTFRGGAFGRGRCDRRAKFGGPPLLKLSLKVKRNSAGSQRIDALKRAQLESDAGWPDTRQEEL